MSNVMKVLGFRRGNSTEKTYASKDEANMVIESILLHYGVDPYSHHVSGADGDNAAQFRETSETRTSEEHGTCQKFVGFTVCCFYSHLVYIYF